MADSNQSPQQTTKTALQRIDQALPKFQKVYGENANTIFQRESGFAALAIRKNPFLLKCDPDSMYEAIVSLAFTGLTLNPVSKQAYFCLLYTSDAADDMQCVDLGGSRLIKKKKQTRPYSDY